MKLHEIDIEEIRKLEPESALVMRMTKQSGELDYEARREANRQLDRIFERTGVRMPVVLVPNEMELLHAEAWQISGLQSEANAVIENKRLRELVRTLQRHLPTEMRVYAEDTLREIDECHTPPPATE